MTEETKETNPESQGSATLEDIVKILTGLQDDIAKLKKDNETITAEVANVRAVNTSLLTSSKKTTVETDGDKELKAKFDKYLKGE